MELPYQPLVLLLAWHGCGKLEWQGKGIGMPLIAADVLEGLEGLKHQLEELERVVTSGKLPTAVISDFKETLDRVRGNLWTILQLKAEPTESKQLCVNEVLVRTRLRRAARLVRDVMSDLDTSFVTPETEALEDFHDALKEALEKIYRRWQRAQ